ncbi:MAG TPA: oxidoreductase, partial [Acetobacteraceae bacterium]|nr:oxidoreductase [Acetobacteraceae bacterium]
MLLTRRCFATGLLAGAGSLIVHGATADELAVPTGKPILTVTGGIAVHNQGDKAVFDRPMVEALGWMSFRTRTPWYDAPVLFEGVLMRRLLQAVDASGKTLVVTALNDYTTQIPISDFTR